MNENEIALTADWGNSLSDVIGKITFNDTEKSKLFYELLKTKPEVMSLDVGYIQNTQTGETRLIEVSCYFDEEKAKRQKELKKEWKENQN